LLEALEAMPELFVKFGGHKQAAGLTMRAEKIAEFRARFAAYAGERLGPEDLRPVIEIDAEATLPELEEEGAMEMVEVEIHNMKHPFLVMNHYQQMVLWVVHLVLLGNTL
jgi:single-stranded-DNA-specific exonuclease